MTREEAIEVIKLAMAQVEWDYPMDYAAAFDMAIKALEQELIINNDSGVDYKINGLDDFIEFGKKAFGVELTIKALEQEPILNKIRAAIEKLRPNLRPEQMTDYDYAMVEVVDDIVAIIDKYKADKEQKDGKESLDRNS